MCGCWYQFRLMCLRRCCSDREVGVDVVIGYGEQLKLEMDYVVGSRYDISVNKGVKIVKIGVGVGVGGLLG